MLQGTTRMSSPIKQTADPSTGVTLAEFEPCHIPEARALWLKSDGVGLSSADEPDALAAFLFSESRPELRSHVRRANCWHHSLWARW